MPISTQAQIGNEQQTIQALRDVIGSSMRVAMPGVIQSFNPGAVTCTVMIAVKGVVKGGSAQLPVLVDVPVIFPRGGGCTITFPIKPGDECLLVFADRCIDFWWQNGGTQEPVDPRMHDLSDAFAIVGPQSQTKKISGISTSAAQFRSDDGSTFLEINPSTKKVKIVAPGGLDVIAPESTFSGKVTIAGLLTWAGGMIGSAASGITAKISGAVQFIGSITSNGKAIDDSHTHKGVQTGSGSTGDVN